MLIAIASSRRARQVPIMKAVLSAFDFVWYIPAEEADDYRANGAVNIRTVEQRGKSIQLNAALNDGFADNDIVVTLDDDYRSTKRLIMENDKKKAEPISLARGLQHLIEALETSRFFLAGTSPNLNPFYADTLPRNYGHINGQITVQKPNIVRYDPELKSKVDFEYSLAHHAQHGGVVKLNNLMFDFHMYGRSVSLDKNYSGGLAGIRNSETNAHAFNTISKRYGIEIETESERPQKRIKWNELKFVEAPSWKR